MVCTMRLKNKHISKIVYNLNGDHIQYEMFSLFFLIQARLTFLLVFVFTGKMGGWKNQFTVAESEMYDAVIERELGETGIQFKY